LLDFFFEPFLFLLFFSIVPARLFFGPDSPDSSSADKPTISIVLFVLIISFDFDLFSIPLYCDSFLIFTFSGPTNDLPATRLIPSFSFTFNAPVVFLLFGYCLAFELGDLERDFLSVGLDLAGPFTIDSSDEVLKLFFVLDDDGKLRVSLKSEVVSRKELVTLLSGRGFEFRSALFVS